MGSYIIQHNKTTKDTQEAAKQDNSNWKKYPNGAKMRSLIKPTKHKHCGALWTTEQHSMEQSTVVECANHLRYLGVHFNRMLTLTYITTYTSNMWKQSH